MKRLFIIRKDLNMSSGKLAAQVGHCAEVYWMNILKLNATLKENSNEYISQVAISKKVFEEYLSSTYTKVICEAKSKNHILKAKIIADTLGLIEGEQYGLIYDKCFTELTPEEEDGTTLTGIWFCPLPDEIAHKISKKYQLYKQSE